MDALFVDRLLPAELLTASRATRRRARMSLWLAMGMAPVLLLCAAGSLLVRGPTVLAAELLIGGALCMATLPILRFTQSVSGAGVVVAIGSMGPIAAVSWSGYGLLSPALPALALAPIIGFVLAGTQVGVAMTLLAIAMIELLYLAPELGWAPPLAARGEVYMMLYAQVLVAVIGIEATFLYFYDAAWRDAVVQSDAARLELAAAHDAAVLADQVKGRFVANMSHELRTPLNAILGYTELLLEDQDHPDLQRIHRSGRHLVALVDEVLDLARIEEGRLELSLGPVPLREVLTEATDSVRPMLVGRDVELVDDAADLTVWADRSRLRQVLTNLLSNACKFTQRGVVRVRTVQGPGRVTIEVSDTGRGMTPAELERCFEAFEQAEPRGGEGAGLGLAISRRLTRRMGGELDVQSELQLGSTFTVELRTNAAPADA